MRYLRHGRRSIVGAITLAGALAGLLIFVVIPAFATTAGQAIPPASVANGVTPIDVSTGGQPNDCSVFGSTAPYSYRISNPQSQTYTTTVAGQTVKFTVTMGPPNLGSSTTPAWGSDKYMSFTSSGAAIVDVGIKGGSDTARYNYAGLPVPGVTNPNLGFVASDTYLHAGAQSVNGSGKPTLLYSVSNVTFCFDVAGKALGKVFNDANANGTRDSSESGQSGWTLNLYKGGTKVSSTTSLSDGTYAFQGLTQGSTYTVCIVGQTGWSQTRPTSGTSGSAACSGTGESARGYTFTFNLCKTNLDFGNAQLPSVSGTVFNDANNNGVKDSGEGGLTGWTLNLYKSGSLVTTTSSASDGTYTFQNLTKGGSYTVCIVDQAADVQTKPTGSTNCSATGEDPSGYAATVSSSITGDDFGETAFATISGTAFTDSNANGSQGAAENGKSGLTVTLYDGTGTQLATTSTATDGTFSFANRVSGRMYRVCIGSPAGNNTETVPTSGTTDSFSCSSGAAYGYSFTLSASGRSGLLFGFAPWVTFEGTVYNDQDQSGSDNSGDSALSGWTVTLYGPGSTTSSIPTAADGSFSLTAPFKASQAYRLCETPTADAWAQSEPLPSSDTICTNPGELPKGYSLTPSSAGQDFAGNDFGNVTGTTCPPPVFETTSGDIDYKVQLALCKPNTTYALNAGQTGNGKPFVSLFAGDESEPLRTPMLETIVWPYDPSLGQNQFTVIYTDTFPFVATSATTMKMCKTDPRDASDPTGLKLQYQDDGNKGAVLPGTETSCLVATTEDSNGTFTAYVFSDVDGWRSTL
jgi:hypothetical protein